MGPCTKCDPVPLGDLPQRRHRLRSGRNPIRQTTLTGRPKPPGARPSELERN